MTGWVIAIGIAALIWAGMILVGRLPRSAWEISASALLLGLAGYAWQGHPGMPGDPRRPAETRQEPFDEGQAEKRRGLADRYGPAAQWLMLSDGLGRQGKTREAANVLLSGLRQSPNDPNLWLGLGNALMAHGNDTLSPGADFAYRRAIAIAPQAPGPAYFYGVALADSGQLAQARVYWAPLAASAPQGSAIRAELERNIARIDSMLSKPGTAAR